MALHTIIRGIPEYDDTLAIIAAVVRPDGAPVHRLLNKWGDTMVRRTHFHVNRGMDVREVRFQKLQDSTAAARSGGKRRGYDHILRAGGRMMAALNKNVVGSVVYVRMTSAQEDRKGRAHQWGFEGPVTVPQHTRRITQAFGRRITPRTINVGPYTMMAHLPQREWLGFRDSDYAELDHVTADWFDEETGGVMQ